MGGATEKKFYKFLILNSQKDQMPKEHKLEKGRIYLKKKFKKMIIEM